MTVAFYIGNLKTNYTSFYNKYFEEVFLQLTIQFPEHSFLFITETAISQPFSLPQNVKQKITGPPPKSPLLLQYWFNFKIPAILKKHNADVLICTEVCCLRTRIPQCIIINELLYLQQPQFYTRGRQRYYKTNLPLFLHNAKSIITPTKYLQQQISNQFNIKENKITVVYPGIYAGYKPLNFLQREKIKETYTKGKEYFLYSGLISSCCNLITLLKAYSIFKKRQKSNMQLVIASTDAATYTALYNSLLTYKYKNEVSLLENLDTLTHAAITASAYALIYPLTYDGLAATPLQAMQSGIPLITGNSPVMQELCGEAALYINPQSEQDIAENMMTLFKDENKRNELILMGQQRTETFYNYDMVNHLWNCMVKFANYR